MEAIAKSYSDKMKKCFIVFWNHMLVKATVKV